MRITRVYSDIFEIPVRRKMHDAIRSFSRMDLVFAHAETDDGLSGTGFTYSTNPYGAREICSLINHSVGALIHGMDPYQNERIWHRMWRSMDWVGRAGIVVLAVAATDIAMWDLKSKASGVPLYELLGGYCDKVPVYNTDAGWLNHSLNELMDQAKNIVGRGFRGIKIKVGKEDPLEDSERIAAVRECVGRSLPLMVDANERFTHAEAIRRAHMWERFNVFWFEEPCPAEDLFGHAKLKAHTSIPIALGESLFHKQQFRDYIAIDGVSIIQPDACRCGGITEWLKIAHLADCHNIQVSPHFVMELHLPLVAAIRNGLFVEYIQSLDEVLEEPLKLDAGFLRPSRDPGLGIRWDFEKLDAYRASPAESKLTSGQE